MIDKVDSFLFILTVIIAWSAGIAFIASAYRCSTLVMFVLQAGKFGQTDIQEIVYTIIIMAVAAPVQRLAREAYGMWSSWAARRRYLTLVRD
jgi:hypothetical protein